MRLLVDKLPFCKGDCIFVKPRWDANEEDWIFYCKFTKQKCGFEFDPNGYKCRFMKEQMPNEDCISKKWVLNKIHAYADADATSNGASVGAYDCAEFVKNAPSVVPSGAESKLGKWIVDRYCSECEWDKQEAGYTSGWRENYCPNCGARMWR